MHHGYFFWVKKNYMKKIANEFWHHLTKNSALYFLFTYQNIYCYTINNPLRIIKNFFILMPSIILFQKNLLICQGQKCRSYHTYSYSVRWSVFVSKRPNHVSLIHFYKRCVLKKTKQTLLDAYHVSLMSLI